MTMDTFWRARLGSIGALLYLGLTLSAPAQVPSNPRVPASTHGPKGFGLKDYTVTVIPATTTPVEVRCPSGHVVILSSCESLSNLFAALTSSASEGRPC